MRVLLMRMLVSENKMIANLFQNNGHEALGINLLLSVPNRTLV